MRYRRHGWVEWLKHDFVVWLAWAVAVGAVLMIAWLMLPFAAKPALGGEQRIKTPQACVELASVYGFSAPDYYTRSEARQALSKINLWMILVPEARACRNAIKMELKK